MWVGSSTNASVTVISEPHLVKTGQEYKTVSIPQDVVIHFNHELKKFTNFLGMKHNI